MVFFPLLFEQGVPRFHLAQGFAVCAAASAGSAGVRILLGTAATSGNSLPVGVAVSHLDNGGNISQLLRIKVSNRAAKPCWPLRTSKALC